MNEVHHPDGARLPVTEILAAQLEHDRRWRTFSQLLGGGDVGLVEDLQLDLLEILADSIGIPRDNTEETHACDRANETGVWPEEAYCRDWIWNAWNDVILGARPLDSFVSELYEAAANDR